MVLYATRPKTLSLADPCNKVVSRLNGWPIRSPTDASPTSSRTPAHGSGATWIATPSSQWTFTTYSLPVSRRTHSRCGLHTRAVCAPQQQLVDIADGPPLGAAAKP